MQRVGPGVVMLRRGALLVACVAGNRRRTDACRPTAPPLRPRCETRFASSAGVEGVAGADASSPTPTPSGSKNGRLMARLSVRTG